MRKNYPIILQVLIFPCTNNFYKTLDAKKQSATVRHSFTGVHGQLYLVMVLSRSVDKFC